MDEITIYRSKWHGVKILGGSLFFVILGIDMVTGDADDLWLGWLTISFFSLLTTVGLFQIFDRRPIVIMNNEGITIRNMKSIYLEWDLINRAEIRNTTKWSKVIFLYVKEGHSLYKNRSTIRKIMHLWDKNMGYGDAIISVSNLKVDPDRFLNLLNTLINSKEPDRKALIKDLEIEGEI